MSDQFRRWVCPTLCGCVLEEKTTWVDSDGDGVLDDYTFNGPVRIISQCEAHAEFTDLESLNAELRHFHGVAYRPDTHGCNCSVAFYTDDREPLDGSGASVMHPVEHPTKTKRCRVHRNSGDHCEHHAAIFAENRRKNEVVNAVAATLDLHPTEVPYTMDRDRNVVIDHVKLGVRPDVIAAALDSIKS